jgi:hypothetical protein
MRASEPAGEILSVANDLLFGTRKSADSAHLVRGTFRNRTTPPSRELITAGRSSPCASFCVEEVTLLFHHRRFVTLFHPCGTLILSTGLLN